MSFFISSLAHKLVTQTAYEYTKKEFSKPIGKLLLKTEFFQSSG